MKGGLFLNEMGRVLLSTPTEREREEREQQNDGEGGQSTERCRWRDIKINPTKRKKKQVILCQLQSDGE